MSLAQEPPRRKPSPLPGIVAAAVTVLVMATFLAVAGTPYVYAELSPWLAPHRVLDPSSVKLARGHMVDDLFSVEDLGGGTYAIGEPRYYQQNYAYLIVGQTRAMLFDAGSGTGDISRVVRGLTSLPVTVMVSHLHFDHLGGIAPFDHVAMVDLHETRIRASGDRYSPGRYEWLGMTDQRPTPTVKVSEWLKPGAKIDLGGRTLTLLATPGHTSSSVSLFDPADRRLFIGDFIYPGHLYAFLPGASLSEYQNTTHFLLANLPADTIIWTAHCCRVGQGVAAPWLTPSDLADLDHSLTQVRDGKAKGKGFYPRVYPVNGEMSLAAGFPWTNP